MEEFRIDPSISYDVITLPSRGIHYPNGKKSLRVAHLTASDENIIMGSVSASSNIIDELLKRKVLDKDIDISDIVDEDRQAIMIFLRNTAFGSEYKVNLVDPKTQEPFEHTFDLSELTFSDFDITADSNGEFSYRMEKSGIDITFKFLTKKQEDEIQKIKDGWKDPNTSPPLITKELEFLIKSVNGDRNPMTIYQFIQNMPIMDSKNFRKYVSTKRPKINLLHEAISPSKEKVQFIIGFGLEFFRPFYGL